MATPIPPMGAAAVPRPELDSAAAHAHINSRQLVEDLIDPEKRPNALAVLASSRNDIPDIVCCALPFHTRVFCETLSSRVVFPLSFPLFPFFF